MKKVMFLLAFLPMVMLTSCSKDDDGFDYDMETLYGTWIIETVDGINANALGVRYTTATFNLDGTYYGSGYFGTGSGTYEAEGKTITCYVKGKLYAQYRVISLSGNRCELEMSAGGENSIIIGCVKI